MAGWRLLRQAARVCAFAATLGVGLFGAQSASAVTIYAQGWNTPGDTQGWTPDVLNGVVSVPAAGGNPGGYLDLAEGPTFDIVGGVGNFPPIIGNYAAAGIFSVSFDINLFSGTFTLEAFRVRYKDATFNGWYHPVTYVAGGGWEHFVITFDPTWSDAQAIAAGWVSEGDQDFATTMSDVFNPEIRLEGTGSNLHGGLDNFQVDARVLGVDEPGTVPLFVVGLLSLFGAMRRARRA